jgi:hypothetical protein
MESTVQDSNIADESPAWDGDARIHRPVQGSWLLVLQLHLFFSLSFPVSCRTTTLPLYLKF